MIGQGLFGLLAVISACSAGVLLGESAETLRSIAIVALLLINLALIQINRTPGRRETARNPAVWIVAGAAGTTLLAALFIPVLRSMFHLGTLSGMQFGTAALAAIGIAMLLTLLQARFGNR